MFIKQISIDKLSVIGPVSIRRVASPEYIIIILYRPRYYNNYLSAFYYTTYSKQIHSRFSNIDGYRPLSSDINYCNAIPIRSDISRTTRRRYYSVKYFACAENCQFFSRLESPHYGHLIRRVIIIRVGGC